MSEPRPLTLVQFAHEHGLVTTADVESHIHAGLRSMPTTKTYARWNAATLAKLQSERDATTAAYRAAIQAGEIREVHPRRKVGDGRQRTPRPRINTGSPAHSRQEEADQGRRMMQRQPSLRSQINPTIRSRQMGADDAINPLFRIPKQLRRQHECGLRRTAPGESGIMEQTAPMTKISELRYESDRILTVLGLLCESGGFPTLCAVTAARRRGLHLRPV